MATTSTATPFVNAPLAYSYKSFCGLVGISRATLYNLIAEGKGPRFMKLGRGVRISHRSALTWIAERESAALARG